jgi:hypothetical protein
MSNADDIAEEWHYELFSEIPRAGSGGVNHCITQP